VKGEAYLQIQTEPARVGVAEVLPDALVIIQQLQTLPRPQRQTVAVEARVRAEVGPQAEDLFLVRRLLVKLPLQMRL
jgi:hypothetical protein